MTTLHEQRNAVRRRFAPVYYLRQAVRVLAVATLPVSFALTGMGQAVWATALIATGFAAMLLLERFLWRCPFCGKSPTGWRPDADVLRCRYCRVWIRPRRKRK